MYNKDYCLCLTYDFRIIYIDEYGEGIYDSDPIIETTKEIRHYHYNNDLYSNINIITIAENDEANLYLILQNIPCMNQGKGTGCKWYENIL